MNLALFYTCEAERKSLFFAQWGAAELTQSLGSKNNGGNVSYQAIRSLIIIAFFLYPQFQHEFGNF